MLVTEFLEPEDISVEQLAGDIGVTPERIADVIAGVRPVDAELDLRFSRYFRMSEGFFLRLQSRYEIVEAKRVLNGEQSADEMAGLILSGRPVNPWDELGAWLAVIGHYFEVESKSSDTMIEAPTKNR